MKAINAIHMGNPEQAGREVEKIRKMDPDYTAQTWRETTFASDQKLIDRQVADLIEAGLPEK